MVECNARLLYADVPFLIPEKLAQHRLAADVFNILVGESAVPGGIRRGFFIVVIVGLVVIGRQPTLEKTVRAGKKKGKKKNGAENFCQAFIHLRRIQ